MMFQIFDQIILIFCLVRLNFQKNSVLNFKMPCPKIKMT